jgi:hypothetical protein
MKNRTASEAVETIANVLIDLQEVVAQLPVAPDQADATARIMDRLAEETNEAAAMIRAARNEIRPTAGRSRQQQIVMAVTLAVAALRPSRPVFRFIRRSALAELSAKVAYSAFQLAYYAEDIEQRAVAGGRIADPTGHAANAAAAHWR